MTTLSEFKALGVDAKGVGDLTHQLNHKREVAAKALPALIAVAEQMAEEIVRTKRFFERIPKGIGRGAVGPLYQDLEQALAAYEAWKNEIEGEK